ncbi:hypothetical protein L0337_01445 [candidate division KSB1 bacterium]|nr:hypothetical protein [candidate division KSB1 bacterium]
MKSTRGLLIALAAACALGTSVGCYTMLKHPHLKIDDKASYAGEYEYGYDNEAISFADDCASCHSPGSLQVHHPAVPPPRRFVSPAWDYYYDYPWWMTYYTPGNSTEEEQKKRPFDRRHQSRPEESVAAPSSASTPASPTPAPATVAKPADPGAPPNPPAKTENTNKREERDSEKKQSGERRTRKP